MSSDIPTYNASFSESEAIEWIQKIIKIFTDLQIASINETTHKIFQNLSQSYFNLKIHVKALSAELLRLNYVSIISNLIIKFNEIGYFSNDEIWFCTYYALNGLWNFCDYSQEIADAILNTDLPQLLISNVLNKTFIQNLKSTNNYYVIKSSVSIIHNVVRVPGHEGVFQNKELKQGLIELIHINESDFIGLISILTLACLVKETELNLLEEGKNSINILIEKIRQAMDTPDKRINGFAIWELVNGLKCVSANDNMKKNIVREKGIQLIFDILKTPSCEEDIEKCLGVLWNLCFDKEIKQSLIVDYNLGSVIKSFEKHASLKIRKSTEGISWLIENKAQSKQRLKSAHLSKSKSSKDTWKFDLFFSYSWSNKSVILPIRDELLKSNIKVWIDIDQMKGSTLEAMADGIENSNIFVMAISNAYRTSPNCRTEAEYAFSLKKPIIPLIVEFKYKPTSWLGLIMGSKTYYEFSDRRNLTESFSGLLSNIKSLMNGVEEIIIPKTIIPEQLDIADNSVNNSFSNQIIQSNIYKWSNKDVENWLIKYKLDSFKLKFSNYDGKLLSSLINLNFKSPDFLFETLKNEYGMKLLDILKFNLAINEINM